jgi:curved DNA-binding protein CbpA
MVDPYQTLGLSSDADEATVRRRYLELVKQYSPEKSPQKFSQIRAAYDELRDPVRRLTKQIFQVRTRESLEDIIADILARVRSARIPTETLLSFAEE